MNRKVLVVLAVLFSFAAGWGVGTLVAQVINQIVLVPTATGVAAQIAAQGTDTNISIALVPKGGGTVLPMGTTAPTCGTATTAQCTLLGGGTDAAVKAQVSNPPNWSNSLVITFASTKTAAPACVASLDGASTYGYYIWAVTTTTTTATVKLGGAHGVITSGGWSPGDTVNIICGGVA